MDNSPCGVEINLYPRWHFEDPRDYRDLDESLLEDFNEFESWYSIDHNLHMDDDHEEIWWAFCESVRDGRIQVSKRSTD